MISFFGMYKDENNRHKVEEILNRPEFNSIRTPETKKLRQQGLKEILDMGETTIYKELKED